MNTVIAELNGTFSAPVLINLGPLDRIPPGEGREYELGEELIAVFRTRDGEVFGAQARCPHRNGHLADGIIGGGLVVCPLHSFRFELATGNPTGNECPALRTYRVTINENREILLWL